MMRIIVTTSQYAPEVGGVPRLLSYFTRYCLASVNLHLLNVQQPTAFYQTYNAAASFPIERIAPHWAGLTSVMFTRRLRQLVPQTRPQAIFSGVAYPTAILARRTILVPAHNEEKPSRRSCNSWANSTTRPRRLPSMASPLTAPMARHGSLVKVAQWRTNVLTTNAILRYAALTVLHLLRPQGRMVQGRLSHVLPGIRRENGQDVGDL